MPDYTEEDVERHEWFHYERLECMCCRNCGIIQNARNAHRACKGVPTSLLRQEAVDDGR